MFGEDGGDDAGLICPDGETCVIDYCTECPPDAYSLLPDACYGHCEPVPEPPPSQCLADEDCLGGYCEFVDPCPLYACAEGGACWCYGECVYPKAW